ncbi:hypothetical protein [Seleniivibrio woodruffii]|uniref:Uncharacterized protein n=1 Tax=Seleniivibrio woodruffii TaxID=1078050 RepID=A0A4R1KCP5_9BACT|nr:hypothetical protein [Seleniivibrio woodruffii]TCK62302.1 hypothetical protein C8D98_0825 [Seleniivibrio woodruffii]TVZ34581.1 hypothetical protein OF66_0168 [Seleniivibrio woodruffii]
MLKGYIVFTVMLSILLISELVLINSYNCDSEFPWIALSAFIASFVPLYGSLAYFKKAIRDTSKMKKDAELFKELVEVLPPEKTISFFKHTDFHESVLRSELDGLRQFRACWSSVDKEFFDKKIETGKKKIYSAIDTFMAKYSTYTAPIGDGDFASVFPDSIHNVILSETRVNSLREQADELNSLADNLANQYEVFVRESRNKLII